VTPTENRAPSHRLAGMAELLGRAFQHGGHDITEHVDGLLDFFEACRSHRYDDTVGKAFLQRTARFSRWARRYNQADLAETLHRVAGEFRYVFESPLDVDDVTIDSLWAYLEPTVRELRVDCAHEQNASTKQAGTERVVGAIRKHHIEKTGQLAFTIERLAKLSSEVERLPVAASFADEIRNIHRELSSHSNALRQDLLSERRIASGSVLNRLGTLADELEADLGVPICLSTKGISAKIDADLAAMLPGPLACLIRRLVTLCGPSPNAENLPVGWENRSVSIELEFRQEGDFTEILITSKHTPALPAPSAGKIDLTPLRKAVVQEESLRALFAAFPGKVRLASLEMTAARIVLEFPPVDSIWTTNGLIVRQGDQKCIIPRSCVVEVPPMAQVVRTTVRGQPAALVGGDVLDILSLDSVLGMSTRRKPSRRVSAPPFSHLSVVVVQWMSQRIALLVDEVLGCERVVVRGLNTILPEVTYIAGISLDTEGALSLVLDVPEVMLGIADSHSF